MKNCYLLLLLMGISVMLQAQTLRPVQYASAVIAFSSEYAAAPAGFSSTQVLGSPDVYPNCGDSPNAWASTSADGQREFLVLGYSTPQPVNTIRIYQTVAPGAIDTVYLREAGTGTWHTVYTATAAAPVPGNTCPGQNYLLLEITIPTTTYNVDAIRIALNSPAVGYYNELDAVGIANFDLMPTSSNRYADSLIAFSSEYAPAPGAYSASKALGVPDVPPAYCGSHGNTWASLSSGGQREFLELGYSAPSYVNRVMIHQVTAPGAVDTVYLREAGTNIWHAVYAAIAIPLPCPQGQYLEINFTRTTYRVNAVRLAINAPAVPAYWNEIDAVGIQCDLPSGIATAQSGDWNTPATWSGGVVPGPADVAVINAGHNITLTGTANANGLYIVQNGALSVSNTGVFNIGPANGGKSHVEVNGILHNAGSMTVNGAILFNNDATFSMTNGSLTIDGNDGTPVGSVPDGEYVFDCAAAMSSFSFTGGTFTMVDPTYGSTGRLMRCSYNFGPATTFRIGNGTVATAGGAANGFALDNMPAQIGHLVIDATTAGNNRRVSVNNTAVKGNLSVNSGALFCNGSVTVDSAAVIAVNAALTADGSSIRFNSTLVNDGALTFNTSTTVNGAFTNHGGTTMTGGSFSTGGDFLNAAGAVYNVTSGAYTSVNGNVVNDGTFNSGWLYFANNFSAAATSAQTIGGNGMFNIYGLAIRNSHAAGVMPLLNLGVEQIFFYQGKFFLGNYDLTLNNGTGNAGAPDTGSYIVLNGTGKVIANNITAQPVLFPVGTSISYTPATLSNGSGHNFSVSLLPALSHAPAGNEIVNREWNITDLTGGPVSATLTLQWNAADENPAFSRTGSYISHYGTAWRAVNSPGPATGTDPYTQTATNVSSFSPFAIGSGGSVLPVRLLDFTATGNKDRVLLSWKVAHETGFAGYEVERSADGIAFSKIGTIMAIGAGSYSHVDMQPLPKMNYYRLKLVDINGTATYSRIVAVRFGEEHHFQVHPNPASDVITVTGSSQLQQLQVLDLNGKVIKVFKPCGNDRYSVKDLPQGEYVLRAIEECCTHSARLLVQ